MALVLEPVTARSGATGVNAKREKMSVNRVQSLYLIVQVVAAVKNGAYVLTHASGVCRLAVAADNVSLENDGSRPRPTFAWAHQKSVPMNARGSRMPHPVRMTAPVRCRAKSKARNVVAVV